MSFFSSTLKVGEKCEIRAQRANLPAAGAAGLTKTKAKLEAQVKVDRSPSHTHWGRIDPRTGIDQRAEVGLLSRNVRVYGEMSSQTCQYAWTRESLGPA